MEIKMIKEISKIQNEYITVFERGKDSFVASTTQEEKDLFDSCTAGGLSVEVKPDKELTDEEWAALKAERGGE